MQKTPIFFLSDYLREITEQLKRIEFQKLVE